MKVPETVKNVLEAFPINTLSPHELPYQEKQFCHDGVEIAVYEVDSDGYPIDPKCLEAFSLLILAGKTPNVEVLSPRITSANTLPIVFDNSQGSGSASVTTKTATLVKKYFPNASEDPHYITYRSLIDTWLDDAWHETVMEGISQSIRSDIYGSKTTEFPWPFSLLSARGLDEHLDERVEESRRGTGDDYICSKTNMKRAQMTLDALKNAINLEFSEPSTLDILIFSYIWPICEFFPESALATLIHSELREHSHRIRAYLLNLTNKID